MANYPALTIQNGVVKTAQDADVLLVGGGTRHSGLTTVQRDALTPLTGMLIYNTTTQQFEAYNGTAWTGVGSGVQKVSGPGGTTNQLVGAPLVVWRYKYVPAEWSGIGTGKSLYFRALLSVDNAAYTASLRVFNLTTATAVAAANGLLIRQNVSPDLVTGTAITAAVTGFDPATACVLAFQLYIDNAAGFAVCDSPEIVVL